MRPNYFIVFLTYLRGIRFKRRCWSKFERIRNLTEYALFSGKQIRVLDGPFSGMVFLNQPVWGPITPKWIGSYEAPLWDTIYEISNTPPAVIIDIGCAEGYYAVGLARRLRETIVYAFDSDWGSMRQTNKMANLNNVGGRVIVGNWCSFRDISRISKGKDTVIICDIEGGEQFILDPVGCPALLNCRILVEAHHLDGSLLSMVSLIRSRFELSHHIFTINEQPREFSKFPSSFDLLSEADFEEASDEGRGSDPQLWMWLVPRLE